MLYRKSANLLYFHSFDQVAASYIASMPATHCHTYGLKRSESLAALFSMTSLAFVSIGLAWEAVRRLINPPEESVDGRLMSGIATIGVVVNILLALVLGEDHVHLPGGHDHSHDHGSHACGGDEEHGDHHSHSHGHSHGHEHAREQHHGHDHSHSHSHNHTESESLIHSNEKDGCHPPKHYDSVEHANELPPKEPKRNVNLHAAYIHVLGDLALSVAVLIAGLVIWHKPEWEIVDPICTIFFCIMVFLSTLGVLRSSISVLLEETPPNLSWQKVYDELSMVSVVSNIHDLHIWSISHGEPALSVHCSSSDPNALAEVYKVCQKFGITHATIQIQPDEGPCTTCKISGCMTQHESCDE